MSLAHHLVPRHSIRLKAAVLGHVGVVVLGVRSVSTRFVVVGLPVLSFHADTLPLYLVLALRNRLFYAFW